MGLNSTYTFTLRPTRFADKPELKYGRKKDSVGTIWGPKQLERGIIIN